MSFSSAKVVDTMAGVVVVSLKTGSPVSQFSMGASVVATKVSGCEVDSSSEMIEVDVPNVVAGDDELLTETGVVSGTIAGLAVVEAMVVSGTVDELVLTMTVVVSGTAVLVDGLAGLVAGLLVITSVITTTVVGVGVVVVVVIGA